jgi:2-keto-4-pentenoate hydratase/2-oxohepta-3-ene-1,7-dioic acid hydratase in catechol pathway|tara:strand:+ start:31 stop:879 length:849 start_codon:yes stop_codon:yes gene_type:complete
MKLVSFSKHGVTGFGALLDEGIIDLTNKLEENVNSLKGAIGAELLKKADEYVAGRTADFALSDVTLLPVIPDPAKIICVGVNYENHRAEMKRPEVEYPTIFTRFADSQIAHRQALIKPTISDRFDFEGEMAVIMENTGRNIPEKSAMNHVAGYACYVDGTVRDWQRHTSQFTPGKTFPSSGAFGPYMVTSDEVGDYTQLPIQTRLNGKVMQNATLADLIFHVPRLINYISQFTPLSAGDVIVTGTPGGVGDKREPPVYLMPGDTLEVEIGVLGTLVNPVEDE